MNSSPDARLADFTVIWADGSVTRPIVLGTVDIYSGRVLSLKITPPVKESAA
jgi:hypothetical protein